MICPKCRTLNPDQRGVCGDCGAVLDAGTPSETTTPETGEKRIWTVDLWRVGVIIAPSVVSMPLIVYGTFYLVRSLFWMESRDFRFAVSLAIQVLCYTATFMAGLALNRQIHRH